MNRSKFKEKLGFTLAEMLMVVAILAILFALAIPAVASIQKSLRQKELDSKAETIYTAVQNRLSELYTSGNSDKYNPSKYSSDDDKNKIFVLKEDPGDMNDPDWNPGKDHVYYFVSGGEVAEQIVGNNTLSDDLSNGYYVIEIIPYAKSEDVSTNKQITAGTVYAVWYSEGELDVSSDYKNNTNYNLNYRVKQNRKKLISGSTTGLGYYGGSSGTGSKTNSLSISKIEITSNEEINKAYITVNRPISITDKVTINFTFTDAYGKKVVIGFDTTSLTFTYNGSAMPSRAKSYFNYVKSGVNYIFTFTLDDLTSSTSRFNSIFNGDLTAGANIKLDVTASTDNWLISPASAETYGNSIYAYIYEDEDLSSGFVKNDDVYISTGRHLQNLDSDSGSNGNFTKAKLLNDISFKQGSEFYEKYNSSYYSGRASITKINSNGTTNRLNVANFEGIINSYLTTLDGNDYKIYNLTSSNSNFSGLFASVNNNLTIKNLDLVGTNVISSNGSAGGFIGQISSGAKINIIDSSLYLDTTNGDIPSNVSSENEVALESIRWINANQSGGLVGYNAGSLNITNSFASTVLGKSDGITGGLVGTNAGNLTITTSYADSYLYGNSAGGLVGYTTDSAITNLASCYSAGFVGLDANDSATSSGLVNGTITSVNNAYTVLSCYNISTTGGISDGFLNGTYYSTAKNVYSGANSLRYLKEGNADNNYGIEGVEKNTFASDSNFTSDSSLATIPYKLMGQSLSSYSYPKIAGLNHYGDWDSSFAAGALVYYEVYKDSNGNFTYGFEGGDIKTTLSSSGTLIGDGYGVVFKEGNVATSFEYDEKTITTSSANYYSVTSNGVKYRIYPLDKTTNNPTSLSNYYTRMRLTSNFADGSSSERYYDYNPHFASTVVEVLDKDASASALPTIVSIRSARQLYNLSKYYDNYYINYLPSSITYRLGRTIDYATYSWYDYSNFVNNNGDVITSQGPIGSNISKSFNATFDGYYFEINNISFVTESSEYIGLFGYVSNTGVISNVILAVNYNPNNQNTYFVKKTQSVNAGQKLYTGVLAGYNNGKIDNCAVTGYYLGGTNGTIKGQLNSTLYTGGLVGYNDQNGKITNSTSDLPIIELDMYRATSYTGGFAGYNVGSISNCYDLTHIYGSGQNGNTYIAGFTAYNSGTITNSYCATSLRTSGSGTVAYAFAPNSGGTFTNDNYLHLGTYEFIGELQSYNSDSNTSAGKNRTYNELTNISSSQKAKTSKYNLITGEETYPYKAVVKDSNGNLIHYGEWQVKPKTGNFGIFYWEYEEGGNEGYHISFVGIDNAIPVYNSTLCNEHDDGGIITSYGYGYYYSEGTNITLSNPDGFTFSSGKENEDANDKLKIQFTGLIFHSFTSTTDISNDYIYLTSSDINGSISLTDTNNSKTYKFYLSPFFGDAIALHMSDSDLNALNYDFSNSTELLAHISSSDSFGREILSSDLKTPGSNSNKYEIRSIIQLQYLNWNSNDKTYSNLVSDSSSNYKNYNYLMSTYSTDAYNQTANMAGHSENQYLYFEVSHDLNAIDVNNKPILENFTPIAGQRKTSTYGSYNAVLYAWFGSHFYGKSYKIQELSINSKSFTVGVFGVTAGAEIKDVILYSKNNATIKRETSGSDDDGGYSIGGLVGIAYGYGETQSSSNTITNCAISGYTIVDASSNRQTEGEANVGGLIGVSKVNLDKCSAVVDIEINCKHAYTRNNYEYFSHGTWGNFIRVGGIAGAVQYKITNCYSGGNIVVSDDVLNETYNSDGAIYNNYVRTTTSNNATEKYSTHVYIAGIAGSGFTMNYQNFTNKSGNVVTDGVPDVENCYTYMNFPDFEGTIRSITMITSMADRMSTDNTGTGKNPTINHCYYLASSADIDVSKAPQYKIGGNNSAFSYLNGTRGEYFKQRMIQGYCDLSGLFVKGTSYVNQPNINVLLSLTYNQFKGDATITSSSDNINDESLIDLLNDYTGTNDTWANVSTEASSAGKYSFPSGNKSLEGKDYPFPSVIRQDNYYVHYGIWPFPSAYFEEALVSMNIFDYIVDDETYGYGIAEYIVYLNVNDKNIYNLDFSVEDSDILEILTKDPTPQYKTDDNGDYILDSNNEKIIEKYFVLVKALKTGSTKINASWTEDPDPNSTKLNDSQTFNVTAELEAFANPSTVTIANGSEGLMGLTACSYGKMSDDYSCESKFDYSNDVTWKATSSYIGNTNYPAVTISGISDSVLYLIGNGYDASLQIEAKYTYNGIDYYAYTSASVYRKGGIGLYSTTIDGSTLLEASVLNKEDISIATSLDINGEATSYYDGLGPTYTSDFYLYQIDSDILTNALNKCVATSCNITVFATDENDNPLTEQEFYYELGSEISSVDANDFSYLDLGIVYRPETYDSNNIIKLYVTVIDDVTDPQKEVNYTFYNEISLQFTPYNLTLDNNYAGSTSTKVKATQTLDLDEYSPERTGYDFVDWYLNPDCSGDPFVYNYDNITGDTTIYAKWTAHSKDITLTNVDQSLTQTITATYDSGITSPEDFSIDVGFIPTEEGKQLLGFADASGNLVIEVNKVDDKYVVSYKVESLNDLIESNKNILYATYSDKSILKLYTNTTSTGDPVSIGDDILIDDTMSSISPTLRKFADEYSISGWFTSDGTQVLDASGNVIANVSGYTSNGKFINNDMSLYAHWIKIENIDAYIKADNFEANNKYIISNVSEGSGQMVFASPTKNDTLSKEDITINKSNDERYYIQTDSSYEWTITNGNSGRYRMSSNGKYLGVQGDNTKVNSNLTSDSSKNFIYESEYLYTKTNAWLDNIWHLRWTGGSFNMSKRDYTKMYIYKYTPKDSEDAISIITKLEYYDGGNLTLSDDIEIDVESYSDELPLDDYNAIDSDTLTDDSINESENLDDVIEEEMNNDIVVDGNIVDNDAYDDEITDINQNNNEITEDLIENSDTESDENVYENFDIIDNSIDEVNDEAMGDTNE